MWLQLTTTPSDCIFISNELGSCGRGPMYDAARSRGLTRSREMTIYAPQSISVINLRIVTIIAANIMPSVGKFGQFKIAPTYCVTIRKNWYWSKQISGSNQYLDKVGHWRYVKLRSTPRGAQYTHQVSHVRHLKADYDHPGRAGLVLVRPTLYADVLMTVYHTRQDYSSQGKGRP